MTISIEAIYEDGVLKPKESLPLREHETVRVTINNEPAPPDARVPDTRVRATAGLLNWRGDAETLERIALDPQFSIDQSP